MSFHSERAGVVACLLDLLQTVIHLRLRLARKPKTTFIVSTSHHDRNRDGKEIIIISFLNVSHCSARDIRIPCYNNGNYNEDSESNKNDDNYEDKINRNE